MTADPAAAARTARTLVVRGTVQGVGFRPFVYRLGRELGLDGSVRNDGGSVVVDAYGSPDALAELGRRLATDAPPRATVTAVLVGPADPAPEPGSGFTVADSRPGGGGRDLPPDLATCEACLRELLDPADRRYRYPFVNCTDCGPRATIVEDLPYDRGRTAMRTFPLCGDCAAEYADPADRRFHAEPVACPACGPRLSWADGAATGEHALRAAESVLRSGGIVAVKGLGGWQLVCDAADDRAVARLRAGKHRPTKPPAVMVRALAAAGSLARVDAAAAAVLDSPARPVVLLAPVAGPPVLAPAVHPGVPEVGVFLPTTGLHHLLLADLDRPLVVTSGNRSGEPIAIADTDAAARLAGIADGLLGHDRPIGSRYDDSVVRVVAGRPALVRRARGYAPAPLRLPVPAPEPLLAVGAQLKHTVTVAVADRAVVGPHTGDLADAGTAEAFRSGIEHLCRLQAVEPAVVVHDLHPAYLSTAYARRWPADRRVAVQHHHAHVASCAAEHGLTGPVLGVAYDGLGLGDDGTFWGGEILAADLRSYRRLGRFGRAPMPGGEGAVRRPARMALGYLLGGEGAPRYDPAAVAAFTDRLPAREVAVIARMVQRRLNSPPASSAGRLFDAAASLLGLRDDAGWEGEAAVALEAAAGSAPAGVPELPWRLSTVDGLAVYDPAPTLAALLAGAAARTDPAVLAAGFHRTVAAVTVALCERARGATGLTVVCLSGGVFQNRLLLDLVRAGLTGAGFDVRHNEAVPTNDGGISYGQAAVAAARWGR